MAADRFFRTATWAFLTWCAALASIVALVTT